MDIRERGPQPYEQDEERMVVVVRYADFGACPHDDCEHEANGDEDGYRCLTCGCADEVAVELPAKFEVCSVCDGRGRHVNPSVDSHGITAEEWDRDWDSEEREGYMRGDYDVICSGCGGRRVELVVDEGRADPVELKRFEKYMEDRYYDRRERESERRWEY